VVTRALGVTLDAGALIALEKGDATMARIVALAWEREAVVAVPATVLAQVWRDGARQARLGRLLSSPFCEVVPMNRLLAQKTGALCGHTGTADVVDASVVVVAKERGHRIVTTDPDDLHRLDPSVQLVVL
jgi:hypothetical protein